MAAQRIGRLTAEQQALVAAYVDRAAIWARKYRTCLLPDERVSVAYEALCDAALKLPSGFDYRGYAVRFVRLAIVDESRRHRGRGYRHSSKKHRVRDEIDLGTFLGPDTMMTEIENRDLARLLRCRFHRLRSQERKALELFCKGYSWVEIAKMMRVKPAAVRKMRQRAAAKLLRS